MVKRESRGNGNETEKWRLTVSASGPCMVGKERHTLKLKQFDSESDTIFKSRGLVTI